MGPQGASREADGRGGVLHEVQENVAALAQGTLGRAAPPESSQAPRAGAGTNLETSPVGVPRTEASEPSAGDGNKGGRGMRNPIWRFFEKCPKEAGYAYCRWPGCAKGAEGDCGPLNMKAGENGLDVRNLRHRMSDK